MLAAQGVMLLRGQVAGRGMDGLLGMQLMTMGMPVGGAPADAVVVLSYGLFCAVAWELLGPVRRRDDTGEAAAAPGFALARIAGWRVAGLAGGLLAMILVNFGLATMVFTTVAGLNALVRFDVAAQNAISAAIGVLYPYPLGFMILMIYRVAGRRAPR